MADHDVTYLIAEYEVDAQQLIETVTAESRWCTPIWMEDGRLIARGRDVERDATRVAQRLHRNPTNPTATEQAAPDHPLATPRQVDYILALLDRRQRDGEGGGFIAGPTDPAEIAQMTKAQASTYITSLKETY